MTDQKRKLEPPLKLDLDFGQALERFLQTDPKEVDESIERSKSKKPPGAETPTARPRQTATPSGRSKGRKPDS